MTSPLTWELHKPDAAPQRCLDEISELRGRVLYANGRRPNFRLPSGRFADPDPLDRRAYHIVARDGGKAVGCIRNIPLTAGVTCTTERLLGRTRFAEMLDTLGVGIGEAVECGRWTVDPDFRGSHTGMLLAEGAITITHAFGFKLLFCSIGTRNKQDQMVSRLGLRRVPESPLIPVPEFDDELCVMYIHPGGPMPHFAELAVEMNAEINDELELMSV